MSSAGRSPLPLPDEFSNTEDYIASLLEFVTSSDLFQALCGGVHILDFFVRDPDVYTALFPHSWRDWFSQSPLEDILDLLMRQNLDVLPPESGHPPTDLLEYIRAIRKHSLKRDYVQSQASQIKCSGKTAIGMKPKKKHEVQNLANYVEKLASENAITHLVDFGSGQNYLGRTLASQLYNRHVVAIEGKESNIQGAQLMDHKAKVTKDVNSLSSLQRLPLQIPRMKLNGRRREDSHSTANNCLVELPNLGGTMNDNHSDDHQRGSLHYVNHKIEDGDLSYLASAIGVSRLGSFGGPKVEEARRDQDTHRESMHNPLRNIPDGDEDDAQKVKLALKSLPVRDGKPCHEGIQLHKLTKPRVMVISLHSCGNLIHHGLRSLILNDFVVAVALIGCCYNLMTERLGPPTYKLPSLRVRNVRVEREGQAFDPHGFPMSQRLSLYRHSGGEGIRFNITARMMAVQAPQNWTPIDSSAFFTRHFFRALLQRIFLDRGIVQEDHGVGDRPTTTDEMKSSARATEPVIIGSLRKACYTSFKAYVRGAVAKLAADPDRGPAIQKAMDSLTDDEINDYEQRYRGRKKDLSIVWSFMAVSAGLVEACVVVDRWLFLREQQEVDRCWVEPVFDYQQSPRNLVVVGIKR